LSNGNNGHKNKVYPFPTPFIIRSNAPIMITDGKAQLLHNGDILVRIRDDQFIELEPREPEPQELQKKKDEIAILEGIEEIIRDTEPSKPQPKAFVPEDYGYLFTATSRKTNSHYDYYKRDKDLSYMVLIKRGEKLRPYKLGSVYDENSIIRTAFDEFSRRKPFSRRDLKLASMPIKLKQGQMIKSCIDILVHEGYLARQVHDIEGKKIERYWRTEKVPS
jgi:hypothetical protein